MQEEMISVKLVLGEIIGLIPKTIKEVLGEERSKFNTERRVLHEEIGGLKASIIMLKEQPCPDAKKIESLSEENEGLKRHIKNLESSNNNLEVKIKEASSNLEKIKFEQLAKSEVSKALERTNNELETTILELKKAITAELRIENQRLRNKKVERQYTDMKKLNEVSLGASVKELMANKKERVIYLRQENPDACVGDELAIDNHVALIV